MAAPAAALDQAKFAYRRVDPPCPYYGRCGGCNLQDLAYEDQLALKRERVQQALAGLAGMPRLELIGAPDPWRYRNKAELTFSQEGGQLTLGYHAARSFWRIIDVEDCLLLPSPVAGVLRDVRERARQTGLPAYHPRTHQGFFRHLILRSSRATGRLLVCLVTSPGGVPGAEDEAAARAIVERLAVGLMAACPAVSACYWGVSGRLADIAVPERMALVAGEPHLEEQVGPYRIRLGPLSFLQPNTAQAERIYARLAEGLTPAGTEGGASGGIAWDLYCGIGLIALFLARAFETVYAIDSEPGQLEMAAANAALNRVTNVQFRAGTVEEILRDRRFWLQDARPQAIVVDPPRAGLHPQALASVQAARPARLAYLSCNAKTLARDLGLLLAGYPRYRIASVEAFDMFPQTAHVETLAFLHRAS